MLVGVLHAGRVRMSKITSSAGARFTLEWPFPLPSLPGQHDFVTFGVNAHGEVGRFAVFGLGFAGDLSPGSDDLGGTGDNIGDLEAHAGPGASSFAPAMNADDAAADRDFTDDFRPLDDLGTEDILIEFQGTVHIHGPDDIFDTFDFHRGM